MYTVVRTNEFCYSETVGGVFTSFEDAQQFCRKEQRKKENKRATYVVYRRDGGPVIWG